MQKLKDQTSMKDSQLSALAGQLKKAGIQPDFKSSRDRRGRSESKGADKGGSRASSTGADVKCYNCDKTGHYARDCPEKKRDRSASRSNSDSGSASSAEKRKQIPCYNHRPWEDQVCLKSADCPYLHVNAKEDLPPNWEFRKPKAKAKPKSRRARPRSGQLFVGTVGRALLTAAALAGCQDGIQQASSLQVPIQDDAGPYGLARSQTGRTVGARCSASAGTLGLSGASGCYHDGTGLRAEGRSVEFSFANTETYIVDELLPWGDEFKFISTVTHRKEKQESKKERFKEKRGRERNHYTIDQMMQRCSDEVHQQECMNELLFALSRAASRAAEVGETGPPD